MHSLLQCLDVSAFFKRVGLFRERMDHLSGTLIQSVVTILWQLNTLTTTVFLGIVPPFLTGVGVNSFNVHLKGGEEFNPNVNFMQAVHPKQFLEGIDVGFTGSRYGTTSEQRAAIRETFIFIGTPSRKVMLPDETDPPERVVNLHYGDCVGADQEAFDIARALGWTTVCHPPTDPKHRAFTKPRVLLPEKKYLSRNRDIVKDSSILVAAPNGPERPRSGTWYTVRYADRAGMPVFVVWPDGTVTTRSKNE